jgi:hypothetical protein
MASTIFFIKRTQAIRLIDIFLHFVIKEHAQFVYVDLGSITYYQTKYYRCSDYRNQIIRKCVKH